MSTAHSNNSGIQWRYGFFLVLLSVCVCALLYRAVDLHVFERAFLAEQGDARTIRFETLEAHRGMITDRHGEPLAVSAPVETIYADPKFLNLSLSQLASLAKILDVSSSWLAKKIEANQDIKLKADGSFDLKAEVGYRLFTPHVGKIVANTEMKIVSNFIKGLSCASSKLVGKTDLLNVTDFTTLSSYV